MSSLTVQLSVSHKKICSMQLANLTCCIRSVIQAGPAGHSVSIQRPELSEFNPRPRLSLPTHSSQLKSNGRASLQDGLSLPRVWSEICVQTPQSGAFFWHSGDFKHVYATHEIFRRTWFSANPNVTAFFGTVTYHNPARKKARCPNRCFTTAVGKTVLTTCPLQNYA